MARADKSPRKGAGDSKYNGDHKSARVFARHEKFCDNS
jgi:hypothetical protein